MIEGGSVRKLNTDKDLNWSAQELLDRMNCGVVAHDLEGNLIFANARLCEWLGYTREELESMQAIDLAPPDLHEVVTKEMAAMAQGDLRAALCVLQRKDRTTFSVLIVPQPLPFAGVSCEGAVAVVLEMETVQMAKHVGYPDPNEARASLARIAMELESLSFSSAFAAAPTVSLIHPRLECLSPREKEVLSLLVSGDRVTAIAAQLDISEHTVRNHLKSIFGKLKVQRQAELIELVRSLSTDL